MDTKKLLRATEEIARHKSGEAKLEGVSITPPPVNVKRVRALLGLSQTEFAARFGFTVGAVRNWEQGIREPEGPARLLMALIASNPNLIEKELKKLQVA